MTPLPGARFPRRGRLGLDLGDVIARIEQRLRVRPWEEDRLDERLRTSLLRSERVPMTAGGAAEVATFALGLSGKRRMARRARVGRLLTHFALAAAFALSGVVAACDSNGDSTEQSVDVNSLSAVPGLSAAISSPAWSEAGRFTDLVLLDPGSGSQRWAILAPLDALKRGDPKGVAPVLADREGADFGSPGTVYSLAAQPVAVGTRDGSAQFLDPLDAAQKQDTTYAGDTGAAKNALLQQWGSDERLSATARAIAGTPTVLDAAYNGAQAYAAGGTHTYTDGVVLRVDLQNPVVQVVDKTLLQSGKPLRAEDVVYVAIRPGDRSLYDPGQVVNLRDVAIDRQTTDVNGQQATFYVANAALDGSKIEPTGKIDLQSALNNRLQRVDADLAIQSEELSAPSGTPTPGPTPGTVTQTRVVNTYRGPSFVDDFLIWMWLTNSGWYRGSSTTIVNPPSSSTRPTGDYYYVPPPSTSSTTPSSSQTTSRSEALQAARNAVSGQAAGTGGGTAATTKAAADVSARASAATSKAASVAGQVSSSSAGKSVSSVPKSSSSTAARSAGSTSSSSKGISGGSIGKSSSSSSSGAKGGSSSFGGGGAKGGGAS